MLRQMENIGYEAFKRVSGNLSLLARVFVVAAIGVASVNLLNHAGPSLTLGDPGDATAFVVGQLQALTHVSFRLMGLGRDVLAFLGMA